MIIPVESFWAVVAVALIMVVAFHAMTIRVDKGCPFCDHCQKIQREKVARQKAAQEAYERSIGIQREDDVDS